MKNIAKADVENNCSNNVKVIAVVKGNAYGLDIVMYTKFLIDNGMDFFAVATIEEAVTLRKAGIKSDILILSTTCIEEEIEQLINNDIILTIGSISNIQVVEKVCEKVERTARAHIEIDTGFGRYGFVYDNVSNLIETRFNNIKIEGTYSHLSMSFDQKHTELQFSRFMACIETLKTNGMETGMLHTCNSSAFLKFPEMHLDAVRIGSAFLGRILVRNDYGLKRVGIFKSEISEIKELPKNYTIGYSNGCKLKRNTKIAIIPVGYADGVSTNVSNDLFRLIDKIRYMYHDFKLFFTNKKILVTINDKKYKVLGKIGMNHIIIDITDSAIQIGDEVFIEVNPILVQSHVKREYVL